MTSLADCSQPRSIISTHILTKRMTKRLPCLQIQLWISTHILTKRMTTKGRGDGHNMAFQLTSSRRGWQHIGTVYSTAKHFNSHPHEEDDDILEVEPTDKEISTHILTKRMTNTISNRMHLMKFQLTSSRRGWRKAFTLLRSTLLFQLTSSRRGWHLLKIRSLLQKYFNSHPHEEDDFVQSQKIHSNIISTHILTKRMTFSPGIGCTWKLISTHILTKRMTALR